MAGNKHKYKGEVYDSDFELSVFKILEMMNFETKPHPEFLLNEGFEIERLNGRTQKIRKMVYTADFEIKAPWLKKPVIIDAKHGIITKDYMMRKKLFLSKYKDDYYFEEVKSQKDLQRLIMEIEKQRRNKKDE